MKDSRPILRQLVNDTFFRECLSRKDREFDNLKLKMSRIFKNNLDGNRKEDFKEQNL